MRPYCVTFSCLLVSALLACTAACQKPPAEEAAPKPAPNATPPALRIVISHTGQDAGATAVGQVGQAMQVQAIVIPEQGAPTGGNRVIARLLWANPPGQDIPAEKRELQFQGLWNDFGLAALAIRPFPVPTDKPGRYVYEVLVVGQDSPDLRKQLAIEVRD